MSSQILPPHAGTHAREGQLRHSCLVDDAAGIAVAVHIMRHTSLTAHRSRANTINEQIITERGARAGLAADGARSPLPSRRRLPNPGRANHHVALTEVRSFMIFPSLITRTTRSGSSNSPGSPSGSPL